RYVNRSARFMNAYAKELTGSQVVWATKRYHSHHAFLNMIMVELEKARKA
ncbi:hypothetical protein BD410DRAFT_719190, partial [Rickenella mellea]